jgi:hypothetical protein
MNAYIHRRHESRSTVWKQEVHLILAGSTARMPIMQLPVKILDGTLFVADRCYENAIPLPYSDIAPVRIHLILADGQELTFVGECLELQLIGEPKSLS